MTQRGEVVDDLPAGVGGVTHDAGQAGRLPVIQHDGPLFGQLEQFIVGQATAGQHESGDRGFQPLGVGSLEL